MHDQTSISEALLNKQVLKEGLYGFNGEVEILVLRIGQNVVQEAGEGYDQLAHETSNHVDTVFLGVGVTDIVNFGDAWHELILGGCSNSSGSYFFKKKSNSMTLSRCVTLLLPKSFLLLLFLLLPKKFLLVLFTSLIFLDHCISV
jgi:hypothetical protein